MNKEKTADNIGALKVYRQLNKLKGLKVIDIIPFNNGTFDNGFKIKFENGFILMAQDGEYGDNTFKLSKEKKQ